MRIILWACAVALLGGAVVSAVRGGWGSAVIYLPFACSVIGWALAETAAQKWKETAAARLAIIKSFEESA